MRMTTLCFSAALALADLGFNQAMAQALAPVASPPPARQAFGTPQGLENPGAGLAARAVRGSRPMGWPDQGRSEVVARHGMVATSHHLAAQAGLEILEKGGNAIDAAVATAAALSVTSQNDTGIGGDMFALVWSARDKKLYALNAAGWSPAAWTPDYFKDRRLTGVNSITVPGAVAGFDALLKRFGTMGFPDTLARAAALADEGFGVPERHHSDWLASVDLLRGDSDSRRELLVDGQAPRLYSIYRNPGLASALRLLQEQGADAFYRGPIAQAIVKKVASLGGAMTAADLAEFGAEWVDPVSTNYKGFDVFQLPPPGQGWAALHMLNILESCAPRHDVDLARLGHESPRFWHMLVEAKKLAYADLQAYNGDPRFSNVPLDRLLSKSYAASLCSRIDPGKASTVPGPNLEGGTANLVTADRWGNMVSLVYSVYSVFGSGKTVPGYGFVLHDRGSAFTLEPGHPNAVGPRKRPFHTIITGFVMKDGQPKLAFGNMQGSIQAYSHVTHLVNLIDLGFNLQATADAARYTHRQSKAGPGSLALEPQLRALVGDALEAMGHPVVTNDGYVGGFQGILFERDPTLPEPRQPSGRMGGAAKAGQPVNGIYRAGSDPRKDGHAVGW